MILSDVDIAKVAKKAGFTDIGLQTAISVALAESGGDGTVINTAGDRGLWQINRIWHPEVTDSCALTPSCCATEAFRISGGGKTWTQWVTFKNGSYLAYQKRAITAINALPTDGSDQPAGSTSVIPKTKVETKEYTYILRYALAIGVVVAIIQTKVGYNAVYYILVLCLLFLVTAESKFIAKAFLSD
jgi:hypothetical protein